MCFYDQKRFACGDHKWGHFRQHCSKEYRTGETCGMKLVMQTYVVNQKCRPCEKIDTKHRAIRKEEDKIRRWQRERGRTASIEKAYSDIERLQEEIRGIEVLRWDASQSLFLSGSNHSDTGLPIQSLIPSYHFMTTGPSVAIASHDLRAGDSGAGGPLLSSLDCRNNFHLPSSSESFISEVGTLDRASSMRGYPNNLRSEEHFGPGNLNIQPSCFGSNKKSADVKPSKPKVALEDSDSDSCDLGTSDKLLSVAIADKLRTSIPPKIEIPPTIPELQTQEKEFCEMTNKYDSVSENENESDKMDLETSSNVSLGQCSRTDEIASENSSWDIEPEGDILLQNENLCLNTLRISLVESLMEEFWKILDQDWTTNLTSYAQTPSSSSPRASDAGGQLTDSSQTAESLSSNVKRKWNDGDRDQGDGEDDNEERNPKLPQMIRDTDLGTRPGFSCPFRKHDSQKYNINDWKSCALTSYKDIARLKEHLYRRHLIGIQCSRCWESFQTQDLLSAHSRLPASCELRPVQTTEGITASMLTQIRSRKKTRPNQSEASRWSDIYRVLFPGHPIPSPFFEPVQEARSHSPSSQELASFESFSRRELPRVFRDCLEAAVNEEAQLIEEKFRRRLVDMMKDCQEQVLQIYQSKFPSQGALPGAIGNPPEQTSMMSTALKDQSNMQLSECVRQMSQISSNHLGCEILPASDQFSDSGYASILDNNTLTGNGQQGLTYNSCGCYRCDSLCFCFCHYLNSPTCK